MSQLERWTLTSLLSTVLIGCAGAPPTEPKQEALPDAPVATKALATPAGPEVEGTLALPGLSAPVRVLRDQWGIPYVFAANTPDLIRAQGFVAGQSRLFQFEIYRATATGRLAEVIGEAGLANDREMRLLGIARNAARHATLLDQSSREFLGWYANGLNAYITDFAADHPAEFGGLGITPRPWTLEDMMTVLHFVNHSQAANFKAELTMQKVIDVIGPERALGELAPININLDRRVSPMLIGAAPAEGATRLGLADADVLVGLGAPAAGAPAVGSNNWAIGPSRSASGAAVMVNDPHLDARLLPGVWIPMGLFTPEIRAVGGALPGVPGIHVGRNAEVAFGVTNAYGDSQDLFIERLAPGKPDHYVDGATIRPFGRIEETIRIRDANAPGGFRSETLIVETTVRGPIITGPLFGYSGGAKLSLRTASAELPGGGIGIDQLLTARNIVDVDRAVQAMDVIYFNYVFADRNGGIGHRASGRVPIRASRQGSHPKIVGITDDWQGFIPPDRMPSMLAPARDWVGTGNHDNRPDDYPFDYSSYFAPSYRFGRIKEVLDVARGMRTADQLALMLDVENLQARRLLPVLLDTLRTDPAQADLVALLAAWDGRDDKSQAAPLLYHEIYEELARETFSDELGESVAGAYLGLWYLWQERFDAMLKTPDAAFFDDQRTPARETLPDLIRRVAPRARAALSARYGSDPTAWRWGDFHRIHFFSALKPSGPDRDAWGFPEMAMDGSGSTLQRAVTPFRGNGQVNFFASMRIIADMGVEDRVQAIVSGGVVDRQFHAHQKDQLAVWAEGRLIDWWLTPEQAEAHAVHRQTLAPR
jgi:penicillin amidase